MEQEIGAERQVIATVRSAWSSWLAAREVIGLNQTAVDAAALSLEGVRAENTVGIARSSTSSMPSRNCSTRRSSW
jgi:outer membrane protein